MPSNTTTSNNNSHSRRSRQQKTQACSECHRTKNKCIHIAPNSKCERCARLNKECVPHVSRQGRRDHLVEDASAGPIPSTQQQQHPHQHPSFNDGIPTTLTNLNIHKKGTSQQSSQQLTNMAYAGQGNSGGGAGYSPNTTASNSTNRRSVSIGHGPSGTPASASTTTASLQMLGSKRRGTIDAGGKGGQWSSNNNAIGAAAAAGGGGGGDTANDAPIVPINEGLLKKQKKAHLLPNHQHMSYPPISLVPNKITKNGATCGENNSNTNNSNNNNSNSDNQMCHSRLDSSDHSTTNHNNLSRSSSNANFSSTFQTPEDAIGTAMARACAKHSGQKLTSLKNHYGLQCKIREWISMSLVRRSFGLLGKAAALANRCGITMDRILCGVADDSEDTTEVGIEDHQYRLMMGGRMNYLLATLLEPRERQIVPLEERFMLLPRLPDPFLNLVGCQNCSSFLGNEMRNRWIIIRETHCGVTRFYCSPAFERNVLSWTHISQIHEENLADINSLIFVKDDFRKFLACNAHQISLHETEGMALRSVHAPNTKIRLLGRQWGGNKKRVTKEMIRQVHEGKGVNTLEMDLRFVSFPTMDKTTYYLELFHHQSDGGSSKSVGSTGTGQCCSTGGWARTMSDVSLTNRAAGGGSMAAASPAAASAQQQQPPQEEYQNQQEQQDGSTSTTAQHQRIVNESPGTEALPVFDDIIDDEEWVGLDDVLASGDIDDLLTALLD